MTTIEEAKEASVIALKFNIMPDRAVTERLLLREYRVTPECIEAHFDRTYSSSMKASPTHLTMVVLPLLIQRLAYIYCCTRLGFPYEPSAQELLKIWPDRLEQYFPKMLRNEDQLVCKMNVIDFRFVQPKRHYMAVEAAVNDVLICKASAGIFVL